MNLFRYTLLLVLVFALHLSAQLGENTGQISGTVTDAGTGQALVGANVFLKNSFLGAATDLGGEFIIPNLPAGRYTLIVSMIGYRKFTQEDILVDDGSRLKLKIELKPTAVKAPQVTVTASRKVQEILDSPVSVSVIGLRQIQERAAISLETVLPYEPGVQIVKDQLNIRGASGYTLGAGNRSLLLLDGVPLTGSAAGNITWAIIPTTEIDRIEIVKTGGSALYGSSAMGGVLNIITRSAAARPETRVRLISGVYDQPRFNQWRWRDTPGLFNILEISHSQPWNTHSYWIRAQGRETDGYTALGWGRVLNLTGKIKLNFGERYSASIYGNLLADERGVESQWKSAADPFEAPAGSANDRSNGTKFNLNGFFNFIYSPRTVWKWKGALYDVRWHNRGSNNDDSEERKLYGEWQVEKTWSPGFNTGFGIARQHATIDAKIFGRHRDATTAIFGLAEKKFPWNFSMMLGGRLEDYAVDGKSRARLFAPQLAGNFSLNEGLSLRASIGRGFRMPTIAEQYSSSQLNVFKVEPNPDLIPETSLSQEVGGSLRLPGFGLLSFLTLDAAVFKNDFRNLIEPTPDIIGVIHFENVTRGRIRGAEIGTSLGIAGDHLLITLAYTWLDPVALDARGTVIDTLSYRYRHSFTPQVVWKLYDFSFRVDYRYGSRIESVELFQEDSVTGQDRRVPVHVWNAGVGYGRGGLDLLVRVENLFQYYYVDLERNMGPERNLAITLNYCL
ncbi:MAG: TonB-dependent receptor [Candidatus Neomarinimicrobiota bacterium]